jgi:hypothetical protein
VIETSDEGETGAEKEEEANMIRAMGGRGGNQTL